MCGEADESRAGSSRTQPGHKQTQRNITAKKDGEEGTLGKSKRKSTDGPGDLWDLLARIPEVWIILLRNQDFYTFKTLKF